VPVDCSGLDAIVSRAPASFRCRSLIPAVDRFDTWRPGSVALWLGETGVVAETANGSRDDRPWLRHHIPDVDHNQPISLK
jgi:hypothetical protein